MKITSHRLLIFPCTINTLEYSSPITKHQRSLLSTLKGILIYFPFRIKPVTKNHYRTGKIRIIKNLKNSKCTEQNP